MLVIEGSTGAVGPFNLFRRVRRLARLDNSRAVLTGQEQVHQDHIRLQQSTLDDGLKTVGGFPDYLYR